jgi:hypothetical protein
MWHGSLFKQLPNTPKKKLKLKTPKTILRKPKEGKKENQHEKIEINKVFKTYRKQKNEK